MSQNQSDLKFISEINSYFDILIWISDQDRSKFDPSDCTTNQNIVRLIVQLANKIHVHARVQ